MGNQCNCSTVCRLLSLTSLEWQQRLTLSTLPATLPLAISHYIVCVSRCWSSGFDELGWYSVNAWTLSAFKFFDCLFHFFPQYDCLQCHVLVRDCLSLSSHVLLQLENATLSQSLSSVSVCHLAW